MATLPRRTLGRTGIKVTALSLGAAWIGSRSDSDDEAEAAVAAAFEAGINYVDSDASYDSGKAEPRLGRALGRLGIPRDRYVLSSKVGTHPDRPQDYSAKGVRFNIDASLDALGTDYLDIAFVHDPQDIEAPLAAGAAFDELHRLKDRGVVRAVGLGCREHAYHRRAIEAGLVDVVITFKDYTLLDQSAARDTIPLAQQHDVGVILGSPLDMGQLTGGAGGFEDDIARAMHDWAEDHGRPLRDFALQFTLAIPIPGCVLAGPATAEEVRQCVASATDPIPPELWQAFHDRFGVSPGATAPGGSKLQRQTSSPEPR